MCARARTRCVLWAQLFADGGVALEHRRLIGLAALERGVALGAAFDAFEHLRLFAALRKLRRLLLGEVFRGLGVGCTRAR
jgi:hypothetical protein